jgi:phosphoglycolate phosphatase-like HAD superfamily hydrolase
MDTAIKLKEMKKEKEFLLCVDSDGCAMDTMNYKHKEFFGPKMIEIWELESIREDVLQVWNHVNLYSQWRGTNRFLALVKVFELLRDMKTVREKGFELPDFSGVTEWANTTNQLSNASLEESLMANSESSKEKTLLWSRVVNDGIAKSDMDGAPYKGVREALEKAQQHADIVVISSANGEALNKEWNEHDLASFLRVLAGQEMGSKAACIGYTKEGRYDNKHVLMVGDAPGDLKAAKANGVLYYPIIPGEESLSWKRFYDEAFAKFISGTYEGGYQDRLINEFNEALSSELPWESNKNL